ncbi:MAG TPA: aminotransferase class I/II-fold pyridoxal phosphate-dependent enzyme, partial [Micromonosporaceae bacterium]|nr:aminotransferase class I/II-fold pyridoxal phosphate-dependent enzyme [Micromonosporaceae bacterium]
MVNLSIGTPVDPVPPAIQAALTETAAVPGYPATHGTPQLRAAAVEALRRRHGIEGIEPDAVLPTIGSKELVAALPTLLGAGPGDVVVIPELGYPTYDVGVRL